MRSWAVASMVLLLAMVSSPALAACTLPTYPMMPDGLFKGRNLLSASDDALNSYLAGYVNGLLFSGVLGASMDCVVKVEACVLRRRSVNMAKVVRQYVSADPKRLDEFAGTLTFNALFGQCFRTEFSSEPPTPTSTPS